MVTAYYDDGHLVVGHKQIVKHYVRTWMAFDVISSFPIDWLLVFPCVPPTASAASAASTLACTSTISRVPTPSTVPLTRRICSMRARHEAMSDSLRGECRACAADVLRI